jgi:hypothetical protein
MMHDLYDDLTAQIHKVRRVRLPSVGLFVSPLSVRYFFGIARNGIYKSRVVDVQQNIQAVVAPSLEARFEYMSQSGIYGSYLENTIIEQLFNYELGRGVSATQVLMEANEQQIPIYAITKENIDRVLPLLAVSSEVKTDIVNAIHAGKHAIVPQREIQHGNWQGSGYIIQDSITGAGAYLLEGGLNGGALEGLSCEASKNPMVAIITMVILVMALYFAIVAMISSGNFVAAAVTLTAFRVLIRTLLRATVKKQIKKKRTKKRKGRTKCKEFELELVNLSFNKDLTIFKDIKGSAPQIKDPVWKKTATGVETEPGVAYVSGTRMEITAKFKVSDRPKKPIMGDITLTGKVTTGLGKFKTSFEKKISYPAFTVSIEKTMLAAKAFPKNRTQFYDPMKISWSLSYFDKGKKKTQTIGTSKHKVYVTLDKPGNKPNELYLTVLHLATSNPGAKNKAKAAWKTWQLFANVIGSKSLGPKGVKNWDNVPMAYYPPSYGLRECSREDSVGPFLKERYEIPDSVPPQEVIPGRCGHFGYLFSEVLKVNKIPHVLFSVEPVNNNGYTHMLIKEWFYSEVGTYADPKAKWQLRLENATMVLKPDSYGDLTSLPGISGQNTPTPSEKVFTNHAIIEIQDIAGDKYFDPSYGQTYENKFDFEKDAVSGYAREVDFDEYTYLYQVKKPEGKGELQFTTIKTFP